MKKLRERKHKVGKSKKLGRKLSVTSVENTDSRCRSEERPIHCGFLANQASKFMDPLCLENQGTNK